MSTPFTDSHSASSSPRPRDCQPAGPNDGPAPLSLFHQLFDRFQDAGHNARLLWTILAFVFIGMIALGSRRDVTGSYRDAAQLWLIGADIYDGRGTGFLYLPQAALIFFPAALLPETLGRLLWLVVSMGLLASGLERMTRAASGGATAAVKREALERSSFLFWFASLVTLPLFFSSLRNGQSTVLMAGAMLHGLVELQQARWNRAALWLVLALAIKPLALPFVMLAGALHAPLRWRATLAILGSFAFPFLCQHPDYVLRQYRACFDQMAIATEKGQEAYWAQPFSALEVAGILIPKLTQTAIRGLAALGCLAACLFALRRHDKTSAHWQLAGWSCCYILLMNPRSENSTYGLLGPVLGLYFAKALQERRTLAAMVLAMLSGLTLGGFEIARLFTPRGESIWLAPLAALGFVAFLAVELVASRNSLARGSVGEFREGSRSEPTAERQHGGPDSTPLQFPRPSSAPPSSQSSRAA